MHVNLLTFSIKKVKWLLGVGEPFLHLGGKATFAVNKMLWALTLTLVKNKNGKAVFCSSHNS